TEWLADLRVRRIISKSCKNGWRVAVSDLADIGVPAVPRLLDALESDNPDARWKAAIAIGWIAEKSGENELFSRAVPALIEMLGDREAGFRSAAAESLGEMKDSRPVPALIGALRDEDDGVRWHAAEALFKLAQIAEIDLSAVEDSLGKRAFSVKMSGTSEEYASAREDAKEAYLKIAKAVSQKMQNGGVLSGGTVPKPRGYDGKAKERRRLRR
ncbi:MAG: HEAT repeat domain-containing protein, partial [Candidatus Micrarchaeota archaeon]